MSGGLLLSTVSGDGRCRLVCCPSAKEDTELDQVASFRKLQRPALRHSVEQWAAAEGSLSLSLHEGPNISPLDVNLASKHTYRECVFFKVSQSGLLTRLGMSKTVRIIFITFLRKTN